MGPSSLNSQMRRKFKMEIVHENERITQRLPMVKPTYDFETHSKKYDKRIKNLRQWKDSAIAAKANQSGTLEICKEKHKVKNTYTILENESPSYRGHVQDKLKKQQKNSERCAQIEQENMRLAHKIMSIRTAPTPYPSTTVPHPSRLEEKARKDQARALKSKLADCPEEDEHDYESMTGMSRRA